MSELPAPPVGEALTLSCPSAGDTAAVTEDFMSAAARICEFLAGPNERILDTLFHARSEFSKARFTAYWNAPGTITRAGAKFGQYRKAVSAVGTGIIDLRFQVVPADRVVDVEKWIVEVPASVR